MKVQNGLKRPVLKALAVAVLLVWAGVASASIIIQTVPVGNAGNAADPATGWGAVSYNYNIGEYDVTAGQYTAFLNAVASTSDPYGLYNSNMAPGQFAACGIVQTSIAGGYSYNVSAQDQNFPVNYVTWGDSARFCNWLSNGQPTGTEGNGTTETGSYTLNGATDAALVLMGITRNPGATWCIPTESEWYKSAYYNPASGSYYVFPTSSNSQPSNVLSPTGTNNANYHNGSYTDPTNYLTAVGAFADSPSPYGTFDQGGDVFQWNESDYSRSFFGARGGSFYTNGSFLNAGSGDLLEAPGEYSYVGFRVSEVPEPASIGLLVVGGAGVLLRRKGVRR